MNKTGFTLIELLVVVLIIGILAGIALPQYKKAVEKSKSAEALINFKAIKESMDRYVLANSTATNACIALYDDNLDLSLSGGTWDEDDGYFTTDDFLYEGQCLCGEDYVYEIDIYRTNDKSEPIKYSLFYRLYTNREEKKCYTHKTDVGRHICKYLESQNWEYHDN